MESLCALILLQFFNGTQGRAVNSLEQAHLGPQWRNLKPQKLTKSGEQILGWIKDATSCFPWRSDRSDLEGRERVILSDLLRVAEQRSTKDIGAACVEFARANGSPERILELLDPLVFSRPSVVDFGRDLGPFLPWRMVDGKLKLPERWLSVGYGPRTGLPLHFRTIEQPLSKAKRANVDAFKGQIVEEYSRWRH
jgi:hypothetical protein